MDTLNLEFKDRKIKNVDVLTIKPYYVSTALINFKKGFFIIEPEELVKSTWTYVYIFRNNRLVKKIQLLQIGDIIYNCGLKRIYFGNGYKLYWLNRHIEQVLINLHLNRVDDIKYI